MWSKWAGIDQALFCQCYFFVEFFAWDMRGDLGVLGPDFPMLLCRSPCSPNKPLVNEEITLRETNANSA